MTSVVKGLTTGQRLLRILCATVLLSLGLAHHMPLVVAAASPELSEDYRLPDGSFASLCGNAGDDDHRLAPGGLCETCLLAASLILPPPHDASWLLTQRAALSSPLASHQPVLHGAFPASAPLARASHPRLIFQRSTRRRSTLQVQQLWLEAKPRHQRDER